MAGNKTYFMQFVVAEGGERRRPRRAAVSAYATRSAHSTAPSTEDKERRFMDMIASTRKNGEWGSSEHLQAFCQVYRVDINVYTMSGVQAFRDVNASCDESRDVVHVAFHVSSGHFSLTLCPVLIHVGFQTLLISEASGWYTQGAHGKTTTPGSHSAVLPV